MLITDDICELNNLKDTYISNSIKSIKQEKILGDPRVSILREARKDYLAFTTEAAENNDFLVLWNAPALLFGEDLQVDFCIDQTCRRLFRIYQLQAPEFTTIGMNTNSNF